MIRYSNWLTACLFGVVFLTLLSSCSHSGPSVLTQHNNNQRTGSFLAEDSLTPSNVMQRFGFLYSRSVIGTIRGQPLFVSGVPIHGVSLNVLYVVTGDNWVYAFRADDTERDPADHGWAWPPRQMSVNGQTAASLPGGEDGPHPCGQLRGPVGIVSTPIIDHATFTMYIVFRTGTEPGGTNETDNVEAHHWLAAIDIRTGDTTKGPVEIEAAGFDPHVQLNRPGLLLSDGVIYVGFAAAVCDSGGNPFLKVSQKPRPHGWVFAYNAKDLHPIAYLNTTPKTALGGIWQSGNGLAADSHGNVYALTGNHGTDLYSSNPSRNSSDIDNTDDQLLAVHLKELQWQTELGESILRLNLHSPSSDFDVKRFRAGNWFRLDTAERYPDDPSALLPCGPSAKFPLTCSDHPRSCGGVPCEHLEADSDLGSAGAVVLPNGFVIGGGKQGVLYVLDPERMAPLSTADPNIVSTANQGFQAFFNSWHSGISPCDYDAAQHFGPNIHGTPVVWRPQGAPYSLVYGMPEKDYLKAFRAYDNGVVEERPYLSTMDSGIRSPRGMPGGFLSLSAAGGRNGVLWASVPVQEAPDASTTSGGINGRLVAFDALTLRKLWEAPEQVPFAKFIPPTIAGGKVFRSAYQDKIFAYGLTGKPQSHLVQLLLPTRTVTALWRNPDHLDLFMTSRDLSDGSVLSTNWEAICAPPPAQPNSAPPQNVLRGWRGWFPIHTWMDRTRDSDALPSGFIFSASPGADVTAVRRNSGHVDLFVVGKDGMVMSNFWETPPPENPISSGWRAWFVVPGSPTVPPGQPVTAVWRNTNHLDLFVVDRDGRVMSTYFENDHWQASWFPLHPETSVALPGQPQRITAVWRNPDHLDLFMTDKNGRVMSIYFENNSWQPGWFPLRPESGQPLPGQAITAVWRNPDHLDLFMTDKNGRVMSIYFENNSWQPGWFPLRPESAQPLPGQAITAVWRNPDHLDLFMTDKNGRVMSIYFGNNGWQPGWFPLHPESGIANPHQAITAVWSNRNHLDLFMTSADGRILSIFFENDQWRAEGWFSI